MRYGLAGCKTLGNWAGDQKACGDAHSCLPAPVFGVVAVPQGRQTATRSQHSYALTAQLRAAASRENMHPCSVALLTLALVKCHALTPKRVLVVGGSGRVGASTVRWIEKLAKAEQLPVELAVGGRRQASFDAAAKRLGAKGVDAIKFVQLDLDDAASLE